MWELRRKASLLLSHGHPNVGLYTLGKLNDEAALVIERINNQTATDAVLIQAAAASVMSKDGIKLFNDMISDLTDR